MGITLSCLVYATVGKWGQVMTDSEPQEDLENLKDLFDEYDRDKDGRLTVDEISELLEDTGETAYKIGNAMREVQFEENGKISFLEFREVLGKLSVHALEIDWTVISGPCGSCMNRGDHRRMKDLAKIDAKKLKGLQEAQAQSNHQQ